MFVNLLLILISLYMHFFNKHVKTFTPDKAYAQTLQPKGAKKSFYMLNWIEVWGFW